MTVAELWLLWVASFALVTAVVILRFSAIDFRTQRVGLWVTLVYLGLAVFGLASGVFNLLTTPPEILGAPLDVYLVVVILGVGACAGIVFVRELRAWPSRRLFVAGVQLLRAGRYTESLASFDQLLIHREPPEATWSWKGAVLIYLDRYDEAVEAFDWALRLNPRQVGCLVNKGLALSLGRRYDEAMVAWDRVLTSQPSSAYALAYKAATLQRLGQPGAALAASEQALSATSHVKGSPGSEVPAIALAARAIAFNDLGRFEEALTAAEQALSLLSYSSRTRVVHVNALLHLQRLEEARDAAELGIEQIEGMLAKRPRDLDVWDAKATLLRVLGRVAEADKAALRVRELSHDHEWAGKGADPRLLSE
jgi:tetratricopeptide (TPR) repeat protein